MARSALHAVHECFWSLNDCTKYGMHGRQMKQQNPRAQRLEERIVTSVSRVYRKSGQQIICSLESGLLCRGAGFAVNFGYHILVAVWAVHKCWLELERSKGQDKLLLLLLRWLCFWWELLRELLRDLLRDLLLGQWLLVGRRFLESVLGGHDGRKGVVVGDGCG